MHTALDRFALVLVARVVACFALGHATVQIAAVESDRPEVRFREITPAQPPVPASPSQTVGFVAVPPVYTGIAFSNSIAPLRMAANNNLMNGSGVAAGDFDNDGWCDLYFCSLEGKNALYRNLGDWRFEEVAELAGVDCANLPSTGACFADVDGDGNLDLLVATLGSGVHLFLNQGNGRFLDATRQAGLASNTGSTSLALGDVDGDGNLDLYVANYGAHSILRSGGRAEMRLENGRWVVLGPYANRLRFVDGRLEELGEPDALYLNDGHGQFTLAGWDSEFFCDPEGKPLGAPWDFGLTAQIRDINGDGYPDIYVCNDFQTVDRIWINDGTGRFQALPRLAMRKQSFSSMSVDFADIDRDGHLDFFITEMLGRHHSSRMRQIMGHHPGFPMPGRFDNRPEVVRNTLFWNRGDHTYAEIAAFSGVCATDWTWSQVFLDVDLDGFEDLLVVNGMPHDVQDRDTLDRIRKIGRQTPEQTRTNLLLYPPFLTPNLAFQNRGNLTFEEVGSRWGFDSSSISHAIALADLDNDGDLDLILNCLNAPALLYCNISTAPRLAIRPRGRLPNSSAIGTRIRVSGPRLPDQMQEIVAGGRYLAGDENLRVFAAAGSDAEATVELRWRNGVTSTLKGVRPNRIYEVFEPDSTSQAPPPTRPVATNPWFEDMTAVLDHSHHEEVFEDFARQPLLSRLLSQLGPGVAWVDLDGDGHDDLIIGSGKGGRLAAFRVDPGGSFTRLEQPPYNAPVTRDQTAILLLPGTGTNTLPTLLVGSANYEDGLPLGAVARSYDLSTRTVIDTLPPMDSSCGPIALADYDNDGDLDLFVGGRVVPGRYPEPASSRLFLNENGRWQPDTRNNPTLERCGLVSGAVWSDLDGDGWPELVLACEWGPIRIYQNQSGKLTEVTRERGMAEFTGYWNGVTTADLDGDGRLDIIASNWGLNTGYHASPQHPLEIFFGELDQPGVVHILETAFAPELDKVVPVRSLNALGQAFPPLLAKFPTHHAFSTAGINDMLPLFDTAPDSAQATTLANMVFLNRGAHFEPRPLPVEAQLAPAFAIAIADWDGDGHDDVFLSQNFFALRPELPRLDAGRGLLLRGDGKGDFASIPGQESGIAVYGEQRGAAVGDFNADGRPDLVVTQNGAATRLYRNRIAQPGLRVRLKGPPANPDAIGAVIRLRFGDRLGPARELKAGSGYWSLDSTLQVMARPEAPTGVWIRWPGGDERNYPVDPDLLEITLSKPKE
jgi:enediyne biosynthesis protein E4